jgi:hypothetical protein
MIVRMPKPHRSPDEVRRLLEQRRAENLTFNQLAERSGLPVHVLTHRATQDKKAKLIEAGSSNSFVEVVRSSEVDLPQSDNASGI